MSHFRVRINERLLINTPDTFQVAYIERVLRTQISRMSRFDFATGLVITGFTLQCCDLAVSELNAITGYFFFQCFQAFFEILKVMA